MPLSRQINLFKNYNTILFVCRCCSLAGPSNLYRQDVIDSRLYQLVLLWSLLNKIIIFYIYSFQEWMASLYASWLFLLFICYISCFNSLPGFVRGGTVSSEARWGSLILTPRKLRGHIGACSGIFVTLYYCFVAGYSPIIR